MNGLAIRPAQAEDAEAMRAIYNRAVETSTATYATETRDPAAMAAWLVERAAGGWPALVAVDAAGVAGFAGYGRFRTWPGYRHTVEDTIYVAEDRRARGVGRALLSALIERARADGHHAMVAAIDASNAASLALHARLGFVERGRLPEVARKFDRWLDLVLMHRLLG